MPLSKLIDAVRLVMQLLADRNYVGLEQMTAGQRLDAEAIERAIFEYGRTLIMPPSISEHDLDIIQVKNPDVQDWSIRTALWTVEEGQSDLSLELSVHLDGEKTIVVLDDIHVL
jgi:hypothetical protein